MVVLFIMATYDFSNAIPYAPTHVGELINDELVASGPSVEQLSEKANNASSR